MRMEVGKGIERGGFGWRSFLFLDFPSACFSHAREREQSSTQSPQPHNTPFHHRPVAVMGLKGYFHFQVNTRYIVRATWGGRGGREFVIVLDREK